MKWIKRGRIYVTDKESDIRYSHGKCRAIIDMGQFLRAYILCYSKPTVEGYITCRTFFIDLDRNNPSKIINMGDNPVLELGDRGEFDSHGVMIESILNNNGLLFAYYDGWSRKIDVPYDWAIGLATSSDNGLNFKKKYKGPIIGSSKNEPYLFAAPEVVKLSDKNWHMWYLGGDNWNEYENGKGLYSIYTIKHAFSRDGVEWQRDGTQVIEARINEECQAGPSIFEYYGQYHMIFCFRSAQRKDNQGNYKLGYAYSTDLKHWIRNDTLLSIEDLGSEWDSEMMCYPRVLKVDDKIYLFYSGNDNGRSGFGYAVLESMNFSN